jgi:hypothetical protein
MKAQQDLPLTIIYWITKHCLEFFCFMLLLWLLAQSFELHLEATPYRILLTYMLMKVMISGVIPKQTKPSDKKGL